MKCTHLPVQILVSYLKSLDMSFLTFKTKELNRMFTCRSSSSLQSCDHLVYMPGGGVSEQDPFYITVMTIVWAARNLGEG